MLGTMSTTPPSTTSTANVETKLKPQQTLVLPSALGHWLTVIVEWLAGELSRNPTVLKLAGLAAVVVAAVPGDISSTVVRSVLIAAGAFLTTVVHLAEAKKAS